MSEVFGPPDAFPAFALPIINAILAAQTRHSLFPPPANGPGDPATSAHVAVGVSGGADSICLLHALAQLAPALHLTLHVAHMDHGLRSESCADAGFVAHLAAELGLPFHLRSVSRAEIDAAGGGVEAAARTLRYAFLAQTARDIAPVGQQPVVAVAHHMEDQAETLLIHLLRGAGLQGLSGMAWVRPLDAAASGTSAGMLSSADAAPRRSVNLARPFLSVRRADIRAYLRGYDLSPREDASNQDTARLRNRVRGQVLPLLAELNPQIVPTLARTADILSAEAARARAWDNNCLAIVRVKGICVDAGPAAPQRVVLDVAKLRDLEPAGQRSALRQAAALLGLDLRQTGFERIEEVLEQVRDDMLRGGPHTFLADVAWTALAPAAHRPALLSLHRQDTLPILPTHPYLATAVQPQPLPDTGAVAASPSWTLHVALLAADHLPADWRSGEHPWRAFVDADAATQPVLTAPAPGMAFCPLGMGGRHKQLGDFFTDRKVPPALRRGWPLVLDAATGRVIWVCGHAIAHAARISPATRCVRRLEWRRGHETDSQAMEECSCCAPM